MGMSLKSKKCEALQLKAAALFYYDGAAMQLVKGINVASVTRSGVGDYTVNFTNNLPTNDFVVNYVFSAAFFQPQMCSGANAVGSVRITTYNVSAGALVSLETSKTSQVYMEVWG